MSVTLAIAPDLLPMDYACLAYLAEHGPSPAVAIPSRLFRGEIPDGAPNLVDLGMIEHRGDLIAITPVGRAMLAGAA